MMARNPMRACLLEGYGKLARGTEIPINSFGRDWIRSGRCVVPINLTSIPAELGSERHEYIELGCIRPKPFRLFQHPHKQRDGRQDNEQ